MQGAGVWSLIWELRSHMLHGEAKKKKRQNYHTIQQFHSWVPPKRNKNFYLHKNMYTNIHSSFIHNSWKYKQSICPSIRKWISYMYYIHTIEYYISSLWTTKLKENLSQKVGEFCSSYWIRKKWITDNMLQHR